MVVTTIASLLATGACQPRGPDPREALQSLVAEVPEPFAFKIRYAATGSRARDCFRPYTRFVADVDQDHGAALFRETDEGAPLLVVRRGSTLVSANTVTATPPIEAEWLAVDTPVADPDLREVLIRTLGPDLAGYAMGGDIPPSGRRTVAEAAAEAKTVREAGLGPDDEAGTRSFALGGLSAGSSARRARPFDITTTVAVDGTVRQLMVTTSAADAHSDEPTGWVIDYSAVPAVTAPSVAPNVPLDTLNLDAIRNVQASCDLPL